MSTARLNVWITEVGDPCKIDLEHRWFVHVLKCDGSLLRWCRDGKEPSDYTNILAECGHVEFDVPPGEYLVMATWSPGSGDPHQLGNHLTHVQVVRVNCGDHACVTLFPPTAHFCGTWFQVALNTLMQLGDVDRELGRRAVEAVGAVVQALPDDPLTGATTRLARGVDE